MPPAHAEQRSWERPMDRDHRQPSLRELVGTPPISHLQLIATASNQIPARFEHNSDIDRISVKDVAHSRVTQAVLSLESGSAVSPFD